ncbi:hypothetical protein NDU88_009234 [Pleurodeles waltl]|uniref:Uncharacterized protein n=1 Tax=Pleurodeles waltl TaxID=8319 RepID=A0AAV7RZX0_PLEWA|nr:hypothetical protein NDU88_009234 [Pleurodeles waltl]
MDLVSAVSDTMALSIPSSLQLTADISCSIRSIVAPCVSSAMLVQGRGGESSAKGCFCSRRASENSSCRAGLPVALTVALPLDIAGSPVQAGIQKVSDCDATGVGGKVSRIRILGIRAKRRSELRYSPRHPSTCPGKVGGQYGGRSSWALVGDVEGRPRSSCAVQVSAL